MEIDALVPLLNVEDAGRSIAFYTGPLGFQVAETYTTGGSVVRALLRHGAAALMIARSDGSDSAGRRQRADDGDAVLYLHVPSARDCHAALRAAGVAAGDVRREAYGLEEFRLRDPDGYALAVVSPAMRIA